MESKGSIIKTIQVNCRTTGTVFRHHHFQFFFSFVPTINQWLKERGPMNVLDAQTSLWQSVILPTIETHWLVLLMILQLPWLRK